jgi:hypothetical protein
MQSDTPDNFEEGLTMVAATLRQHGQDGTASFVLRARDALATKERELAEAVVALHALYEIEAWDVEHGDGFLTDEFRNALHGASAVLDKHKDQLKLVCELRKPAATDGEFPIGKWPGEETETQLLKALDKHRTAAPGGEQEGEGEEA